MKDETLLVTEADGFIVPYLIEILCSKGHQFRILSQYNSYSKWVWMEDVKCKYKVRPIQPTLR